MERRTFLQAAATASVGILMPRTTRAALGQVPSYLADYADLYASDPRGAAHAWFRDAKFGLFMHYGVSSLLGRGEWVQYQEKIPVAEYEKLADRFDPHAFDADFITDLAADAGMRYVNITARHHDSFCLFETAQTDFSSVNCNGRRDLVAELAEQCRAKGLGLFLYYSYALDWRHPSFYSREHNPIARPAYPEPDPAYTWEKDEDFAAYIEFVHAQLRELLTSYGPLAGIWFDPIMGFYARPDLFPVNDTYALVRKLQPQCLISFKQGATGTEDFAAPERSGRSLADRVQQRFEDERRTRVAAAAWESNRTKHNEICDTLQPGKWGYNEADEGKHHGPEKVWEMLGDAIRADCNLLLNTGPLPDGSIHAADVETLRSVGRRIRAEGYPG